MKVSALTPLLLTGIATAASLSRFGNDQVALTDDLKIPGDNPLAYCAAPDDYLLTIDHVDLSPNPPAAYVALAPSQAQHPRPLCCCRWTRPAPRIAC